MWSAVWQRSPLDPLGSVERLHALLLWALLLLAGSAVVYASPSSTCVAARVGHAQRVRCEGRVVPVRGGGRWMHLRVPHGALCVHSAWFDGGLEVAVCACVALAAEAALFVFAAALRGAALRVDGAMEPLRVLDRHRAITAAPCGGLLACCGRWAAVRRGGSALWLCWALGCVGAAATALAVGARLNAATLRVPGSAFAQVGP